MRASTITTGAPMSIHTTRSARMRMVTTHVVLGMMTHHWTTLSGRASTATLASHHGVPMPAGWRAWLANVQTVGSDIDIGRSLSAHYGTGIT